MGLLLVAQADDQQVFALLETDKSSGSKKAKTPSKVCFGLI
jgi:hypothetical protein